MSGNELNDTVEAYLECSLWSSPDYSDTEGSLGGSLDDRFSTDDYADEARESARADVEAFVGLLVEEGIDWRSHMTPEQFGHDFLLTRNHHGAGFWDRGLGELGDRLTYWAHSYGDSDAYVGDDGKVYLS